MTYHVKDLEAGPLLDQAVLRALGAVHMQDCPEGVPDNVRERWPAEGAMVLTDEAGNSSTACGTSRSSARSGASVGRSSKRKVSAASKT